MDNTPKNRRKREDRGKRSNDSSRSRQQREPQNERVTSSAEEGNNTSDEAESLIELAEGGAKALRPERVIEDFISGREVRATPEEIESVQFFRDASLRNWVTPRN